MFFSFSASWLVGGIGAARGFWRTADCREGMAWLTLCAEMAQKSEMAHTLCRNQQWLSAYIPPIFVHCIHANSMILFTFLGIHKIFFFKIGLMASNLFHLCTKRYCDGTQNRYMSNIIQRSQNIKEAADWHLSEPSKGHSITILTKHFIESQVRNRLRCNRRNMPSGSIIRLKLKLPIAMQCPSYLKSQVVEQLILLKMKIYI